MIPNIPDLFALENVSLVLLYKFFQAEQKNLGGEDWELDSLRVPCWWVRCRYEASMEIPPADWDNIHEFLNDNPCDVRIDQSHRYGRHQAACREPAGSYDKTTRTAIYFEHKAQYLLIRAPYTRIVVFWHISNIPPMISQSQISNANR